MVPGPDADKAVLYGLQEVSHFLNLFVNRIVVIRSGDLVAAQSETLVIEVDRIP